MYRGNVSCDLRIMANIKRSWTFEQSWGTYIGFDLVNTRLETPASKEILVDEAT